jgi:RNA polymerase sigma-70 factor (ECF subfamily)
MTSEAEERVEPTVLAKRKAAIAALTPRLRRFGIALTGSTVEADELVQSACVRALERLDQLRLVTRLDGWMYRIMRNIWTDEARAAKYRRHDPLDTAEQVVGEDGQQLIDRRLTLAAVRRALDELPAEQRTALTLVCVDGLSYKEAAEILGVPLGTVMSRLCRGRQALHEKLQERSVPSRTVVAFERH